MKIALGQINVVAGQIDKNLNQMKMMVDDAINQNADIIVFPELCVGGYLLADKWYDENFLDMLEAANETILSWSKEIGIIYGNVSTKEIFGISKGRDGRRLRLNCAYFAYKQEWVKKEGFNEHRYVKHLNPDYRIFDDSRYFLSASEIMLRTSNDEHCAPYLFIKDNHTYSIGLEVCEDMWSDDYGFDATHTYSKQNVDTIFNISSSPWTRNKELSRDKHILKHANKNKGQFPNFVYVNCCGMQNTGKTIVVFDGDSTIYDSEGKRIASCNDDFKAECKVIDTNVYEDRQPNKNKCLSALLCAIKEFDKQVFNQSCKYIIGLSGGLDSTVNAALYTLAIGPARLIGYSMSSKYNSDMTKNNSRNLANKLNVEFHEGSIEACSEATIQTLKDYGYNDEYPSLVYENIQARIRGHLLSTFASIHNGVIVNNGNKVEVALGYCTLYGDAIGALCPIGDCTKVQLFEIAHCINELMNDEIIPLNLLPEVSGESISWLTPPSAELKDAQVDPMKWFYHDWLIEKICEYPSAQIENVMASYLDGSLMKSDMGRWITYYGLNDPQKFIEDLEWGIRTVSRNVFKRYQMPPIVMISRGAFGNDYREAQLNLQRSTRYIELKDKILEMR